MAISIAAQEFLRRGNVAYSIFYHRPAYTAQEEAAVTHTPGREWAKTVVCFADDRPIQAVVPADRVIDLDRLMRLAGASTLRVAERDELEWLYPDCEIGAMPPFGPLFRQRLFVDNTLTEGDIVFDAGTHTEAICMTYRDFATLTRPTVGHFSMRVGEAELSGMRP